MDGTPTLGSVRPDIHTLKGRGLSPVPHLALWVEQWFLALQKPRLYTHHRLALHNIPSILKGEKREDTFEDNKRDELRHDDSRHRRHRGLPLRARSPPQCQPAPPRLGPHLRRSRGRGAANSSGEEAPRGERKHLFNPFGCMLGRSYFRRCREEMNEGYFAKVPTGYFPVAPSEVPCRVPVEGVVAGEVLSYSALPLPKIEKRFYKQLNDGTFVRLPFLYPEVYYEGEEEPADERYYIRADAADASSADPSTLPEEAFAKVPPPSPRGSQIGRGRRGFLSHRSAT